jgi:hypothetical protein
MYISYLVLSSLTTILCGIIVTRAELTAVSERKLPVQGGSDPSDCTTTLFPLSYRELPTVLPSLGLTG